jgi:hypothetical protein
MLAVLCGLLAFAVGCGSNSSSTGSGPFSNASLNGSYVCQLVGNDSFIDSANNLQNESYTETLVITTDGAGHLKGVEDFNSSLPAVGFIAATAFTGTYTIGHDGNGSMSINLSAPSSGQINLSITMENTSKFYAVEADAFSNFSANAAGEGIKQNSAALTAAPTSASFVLRAHQELPSASATVGTLNTSNPLSLTGTIDVLRNGALLPQLTLSSGTLSAPDSNGRGTLVYTDSAPSPVTAHYEYYILDANTFVLMQSDATLLGTGRAEAQASGSLTLSGNYVFGSRGDTSANTGGVRSVGGFTAASGTISAGTLDSVQDGTSILSESFTGTYTPGANGRIDASLTLSSGSAVAEVFWMVSPSRAFFLINDANKVEDGTIDLQQQNSFAASDVKGQYALVMDGYNSSNFLTRAGTLISDGNGNLQLNEEANSFVPGSLPGLINDPPTLPGNYTVGSNGRVAATISSVSSNLVFYLVSPSQAYILQNDPATEISGTIQLQTSP